MPPSPPPFSPTSPRRESIPDNAAFPSVRPLGETLPSPPQYARNLPPGQRRLGPQPVVAAGPSRVVGFQPISRTISAGNADANAASTAANTQQQSALTSGRPQVKSSTSFGDLNPPKDIHDEFKYLHLGDRKMKMVITRGVGPPMGKFGKEGKGKPRRVKVDEVGGRVEGFVEVGKVDGCVGLDLTVTGRSLCTLYYNGQPSLLHSRRLVKHRIDLFPSQTPGPSKDKGKGKAMEPTIPHHTTFAFGFDFPRYCELDDKDSAIDDDEDDDHPGEKHAVEPSSFGARAIDIAQASSPPVEFGKRPSLTGQGAGSHDDMGSSSGFSPSSWKNRMESKSPTFGIGKFLKRSSFSSTSHGASTSAHSPGTEGDEGKKGFLRRLSTSQSVSRPPMEDHYDLPPTTNLLLGDVQAEIEYHIRIRLRRKGLRFNDSIMVNCSYEPMHSVQQLEHYTPHPDAVIHPEYPQWQTLPLQGGHQLTKEKHRQNVSDEAGIHAEIMLPFPLLLTLPAVDRRETSYLPTMPFRLRFHSSLPYQYPLLTFSSPETSDWRILLVRSVTVRIHQKEFVRNMPLRCLWKVDTVGAGPVEHGVASEPAPHSRHSHETDGSRVDEPHNPPNSRSIPLSTDPVDPAAPPSFGDVEEQHLATPPPEFAEVYDGPLDAFDPFPPVNDAPDEENIYVRGKLSLCRSAFKSILAPLSTPDILVEYFLDVEIKPKGGSVKETFGPLKQRWPLLFERM